MEKLLVSISAVSLSLVKVIISMCLIVSITLRLKFYFESLDDIYLPFKS